MFRNQCVGMRKLQVERAESKCIDATENGGRENNCTGNEMRNNDTNRIQRQRQQSHERMNTTIKCKSRKEKNQYQMHGAKANSAMQLLECEYIGCVSVLYSCLVMKLVCHFSLPFVCDSANELKQSSYHVFRAFTSSSCSSLYFPFHHVSSTIWVVTQKIKVSVCVIQRFLLPSILTSQRKHERFYFQKLSHFSFDEISGR